MNQADTPAAIAIRQVVENWVMWRDYGDWERFRTCWHDDGYMVAIWFQGPVEDFIRASKIAWERGPATSLHFLGGCSIDVAGNRAIAQTKTTISRRGLVEGILCDSVCTGRFYDFFECRQGRWAIVLRQPIYEKDRIDPVDPSATLSLDPAILEQFPPGYRYLAYGRAKAGEQIPRSLPGLKGPEVEALYARGRRWLAGGALD
ncbi:MAG TPA: nuclear transport factor 2 family protein [Candidatus Binataceae bacterium]|nr:nuclear transport factor 2 family protein [Candidatus Binataceae bacterium]